MSRCFHPYTLLLELGTGAGAHVVVCERGEEHGAGGELRHLAGTDRAAAGGLCV
jgi:hypothetical protein